MRETEKNLAIVIPAYKHQFLRETLESIAGQTCKDFNLYIGDDGSPNHIGEILGEFRGKLDFTYHRFEENLGSKSLVGQWKRCIEMTRSEEWLMILGDDDYLNENFVEVFYSNLPLIEEKALNVVRYSLQVVNEDSKPISKKYEPPVFEKSTDSFFRMLNKETHSSLSEYVFRRSAFQKHGFKEFPLAWHADDLAWLEFSEFGNIYGVNEAVVYVRKSTISITGQTDNMDQKNQASFLFFKKLAKDYFCRFPLEQKKVLLLAFEFWAFKQNQFGFENFKIMFLPFLNLFGLMRMLKFSFRFFQEKLTR